MSLRVIRAGILDTIQDPGRYGWQHLGINPGGVMDRWSSGIANVLVGNDVTDPLLEMHFPAGEFLFETRALIALAGADFSPHINGCPIPLLQPILLSPGSVLQFRGWTHGARAYLAIRAGLIPEQWLSGYSTNLKCAAGGYKGRSLQKGDIIPLESIDQLSVPYNKNGFVSFPWKADAAWNYSDPAEVLILPGNEWRYLKDASMSALQSEEFLINHHSDRMGYRLEARFECHPHDELISSPVGFGTIQLLPNGQLIILMADHQTTGGYPRIAHVLATSLPVLAQKNAGDSIRFKISDITSAEALQLKQHRHLLQVQNACKFRLEKYFHVNHN